MEAEVGAAVCLLLHEALKSWRLEWERAIKRKTDGVRQRRDMLGDEGEKVSIERCLAYCYRD